MAQRRLRVPGLASTRQKVAQSVQAQRHVPRRLRRLRVGHQQPFADLQTALVMAQRRLRVPGLASTRQKVRQLAQAHRHVPRRLRRLRAGHEISLSGFVADAKKSFRDFEPAEGGLNSANNAGDVAKGGVLLAIAPVAHGVLQRGDLPDMLLRRVLNVVLQGEGKLFDGGAQAAEHLLPSLCHPLPHMRPNHAVQASDFDVVSGREQAQAFEPAAQGLPGVIVAWPFRQGVGVFLFHQRPQPRPRDAVGREQRGVVQRGAFGGSEAGKRLVEHEAELLFAVQHLRGHVGVGGQRVHAGQALGPESREVIGGADVRVQPQVDGHALDGQREAAQFAGNLARGGGIRGGGGGGPLAVQLVVFDEPGRVVVAQRVHGDEGDGFLARGGEFLRPFARGDDDAQPVFARNLRQLRLGQQDRLGDVVEDDEAGRAFIRIARGGCEGAAFQFGEHAASAGVGGFVRAGGEGDLEFGAEFAEQREDFPFALRAQRPEAGGVGIRPAVGVGGGQLGLALSAQPMHGGDDAHRAEGEVFVQLAQLGAAADEVGIEPAEIARHAGGAAGALDAFPQARAQRGELLPHGDFAQRLDAEWKPRFQVHPVRPVERGLVPGFPPLRPSRAVGGRDDLAGDGLGPCGVQLLVAVRRFHEIHGRDAVLPHERVDLALEVFLPFPEAGRALEVIGREADEENPALAQPGENAMPPVVHVPDLRGVEEDAERLGGEAAVVGEDFIAQGGDPALRLGIGDCGLRMGRQRARDVVLARVGEEDFVGAHDGWRWVWFRIAFSADAPESRLWPAWRGFGGRRCGLCPVRRAGVERTARGRDGSWRRCLSSGRNASQPGAGRCAR